MDKVVKIMQEEKDLIRQILKEMSDRDKKYAKELLNQLIQAAIDKQWEGVYNLGQTERTPELEHIVEVTSKLNVRATWERCIADQRDGRVSSTPSIYEVPFTMSEDTKEYSNLLAEVYETMADYINKNREEIYKPMAEPKDLIPLYNNPNIDFLSSPEELIRKYEDIALMIKVDSEEELRDLVLRLIRQV